MTNRGQITKEIQDKAVECLGVSINQTELRLMPYIQYCMMNDQRLHPSKINQSEREILSRWREHGWISGGASGLSITKDFWDAISSILWLGYVAYGDAENHQ